MHSSTAAAILLLVASAASPAIAVPIGPCLSPNGDINLGGACIASFRRDADLDARAFSASTALKELGTGALGGGALAALSHFLGGDDSSTSKRSISDAELEARAFTLSSALKELGTGALGGGAIAALGHFLGGDDSSSASKRSISDTELEARAFTLGSALKELGTGALGGGALAALDHFLGGSDDAAATKRALPSVGVNTSDRINAIKQALGLSRRDIELLEARAGLGSIVGKLAGATESSLGTVIKNSALGGLASGGVLAAGGALEGLFGGGDSNSRRDLSELEARAGAAGLLGKLAGATEQDLGTVIKNSALGGLASGGVVAAGKGIESLFGGDDSTSRRDLSELEARAGAAGLFGKLAGATEQDLGTVIKNSALGGLASGGVVAAGKGIEGLFGGDDSNSRRDLEARVSATGKGIIGTLTGLAASSLVGPAVNEIESLFGGGDSASKRELEARVSPIGKGLIGTLTGLAASSAVGPAISGIESLFNRDVSDESLLALHLLASRALNELD